MNPTDRMQDPFYAGLLFQIESIICQADDDARTRGMHLTDSQVRSALLKARKQLRSGSHGASETSKREGVLAELVYSLMHAPGELMKRTSAENGGAEGKSVSISDWVKALETVEDSVNTRKSGRPGSRDYLDFVREFIAQARGVR